jgi:hypothetical protein
VLVEKKKTMKKKNNVVGNANKTLQNKHKGVIGL